MFGVGGLGEAGADGGEGVRGVELGVLEAAVGLAELLERGGGEAATL